jgi:nucleotide-binding universal stress UspA family protein
MYEDILLPTDGSESVQPAVELGLEIARGFEATVHVLHVVDSSPMERKLALTAVPNIGETLPESWYDSGDSITDRIADRATEWDLDTVTEVRRGVAAQEIGSYIVDEGIDLVCMGTRGHTGLDRFFLGSVTRRTVRSVDVPVISINPGAAERDVSFDRILVPTDGSKPAEEAVNHAMEFARRYKAILHALYVVDRGAYASRPGFTWDELRDALEAGGRTVLEDVESRASESGVAAVTELRRGAPHRSIAEYADEHDVDLIAMGTHGRTGIAGRIIGSVTERVLQAAPAPVLTLRSG